VGRVCTYDFQLGAVVSGRRCRRPSSATTAPPAAVSAASERRRPSHHHLCRVIAPHVATAAATAPATPAAAAPAAARLSAPRPSRAAAVVTVVAAAVVVAVVLVADASAQTLLHSPAAALLLKPLEHTAAAVVALVAVAVVAVAVASPLPCHGEQSVPHSPTCQECIRSGLHCAPRAKHQRPVQRMAAPVDVKWCAAGFVESIVRQCFRSEGFRSAYPRRSLGRPVSRAPVDMMARDGLSESLSA